MEPKGCRLRLHFLLSCQRRRPVWLYNHQRQEMDPSIYTREEKSSSKQWAVKGDDRPLKMKWERSTSKVYLIDFWDNYDILLEEYGLEGNVWVPHTHSPYLAPFDYYLFANLHQWLRRQWFCRMKKIREIFGKTSKILKIFEKIFKKQVNYKKNLCKFYKNLTKILYLLFRKF